MEQAILEMIQIFTDTYMAQATHLELLTQPALVRYFNLIVPGT